MEEETKEQLEKEKLDLEIAHLKRPFFKNIEVWKLLVPSLILFVSIVITYQSGILDVRSQKLEATNEKILATNAALEAKKLNLEYDIKQFQTAKTLLNDSNLFLSIQLAKLQMEYYNGRAKMQKAIQEYSSLQQELENTRYEINKLVTNYSGDTSFCLRKYKEQFKRATALDKEVVLLATKLDSLTEKHLINEAALAFYAGKSKLSDLDTLYLDMAKTEATMKYHEAKSAEYDSLYKNWNYEFKPFEQIKEEIRQRIAKMSPEELRQQWIRREDSIRLQQNLDRKIKE